eukprot:CAMPEP_0198312882 /NCGR_PEP_ID=MMETSP1450-20131203/4092_1 /TAXON_ID=753684 ORGANISM="Madagascaria erythrocladiodes, Strain CCMP3234" /NCGR_SAMPLE_ID=MMETSP1450 /ASSEMBLY_ACC=CAM_ASM_001115 /LENGTH=64 /DNA_ID=CAMNT_0044015845 /DNA_START=106 /DNA_END=296 /DNA_ORIENTATION=+
MSGDNAAKKQLVFQLSAMFPDLAPDALVAAALSAKDTDEALELAFKLQAAEKAKAAQRELDAAV